MNQSTNGKPFELALAEMRQDYILSLDEKLNNIESLIMTISASNDPSDKIAEVFRDVHSLKGTSGTFELPLISTICHQLENNLEKFNGNAVDNCLNFIDLIRRAVELIIDSPNPDFSKIELELYKTQKRLSDNKILAVIVDDSRSNYLMTQKILENYPIKFTILNDGLVALTRLLFIKYDLIIMSKELPSLSGPGLLAALHATNCANKTTPSIILSSSNHVKEQVNDSLIFPVQRNSQFLSNITTTIESIYPDLSH